MVAKAACRRQWRLITSWTRPRRTGSRVQSATRANLAASPTAGWSISTFAHKIGGTRVSREWEATSLRPVEHAAGKEHPGRPQRTALSAWSSTPASSEAGPTASWSTCSCARDRRHTREQGLGSNATNARWGRGRSAHTHGEDHNAQQFQRGHPPKRAGKRARQLVVVEVPARARSVARS